jgi:signal transduction histidine kinase/CheY-like chemotaxis protein
VRLSAESPRLSGYQRRVARYLLAIGIVAAASLLRLLADPLIHDQIPYFIYVASVVVSTWFCGTGGGLISTILAGFLGNYLFVPPRYELVPHGEDWVAMGLFWGVAVGLVWLVGRWKRAELVLRRQAQELRAQGQELRAQAVELHAQADRLQALHSEAERVNRVKDEFLATLSHELRTPLNAIVGWAHLLVGGGLEPVRQKTAADTILRNANAQVRLVEDLLDVSRIISGKLHLQLAPVDLAGVVSAALELVRNAAEAKGIELSARLAPGAVMLGDAERLQQIAWNLLSNAVKFTRKNGRVEIRLDSTDAQFELTVSDTGVGIEPEFVPHLFERFSQADSTTTRRHGGLGLGLAVVRHLVELHGGTVRASSEGRDRGATFQVTLPVQAVTEWPRADLAIERRGGVSESAPLVLHKLRVLVVDDEEDARELVAAVLSEHGADVRVARSAHEAFHEVRNWRPDVLLADIGMPLEDGYSLLRRIRALSTAEGGSMPAAALTAYAQLGDRERALAAGFQEHVPKPVTPGRLVHIVARLARGGAAGPAN